MVERPNKQASSPDHGSSISKPSKKRKKAPQQSSDSSPKQSDSSTVERSRPKKARKPPRDPEPTGITIKSPSKDVINTAASKNRNDAVLKTPSPKATKAQGGHDPPESPPRVPVNDLAQLSPTAVASEPEALGNSPKPSSKASSPSKPSFNGSSPSKTHLSPDTPQTRLFGRSMTRPNPHAFGPSVHPVFIAKKQGMGWSDVPTHSARQQPLFPNNASPLGPTVNHTRILVPQVMQQANAERRQQEMAKLYQESQLHQEAQFAMAHRVMLEKAQENNPNRQCFLYNNTAFTLRECLLACSLKTFCRMSNGHPGEGLSDDTIGEILQYQRGWRVPNGLNCQGLCTVLIREGSKTRRQIEESIRGDRHRWENYAWKSYWGWLNVMSAVCARMNEERHAGVEAARGFQNRSLDNANHIHDHCHQQQVAGFRVEHIDYGRHPQGYLPRANIAAAIGTLERPSNEEGVSVDYTRVHQWAVGNMRRNFNLTSDGEPSESRVGHNEEYLPQMETAINEGSFSFE